MTNNQKKKLPELDDFFRIVPRQVVEEVFGKRELNHFDKYMFGQTQALLHEQGGIYVTDIARFLTYRKQGLTGKKMPLDD